MRMARLNMILLLIALLMLISGSVILFLQTPPDAEITLIETASEEPLDLVYKPIEKQDPENSNPDDPFLATMKININIATADELMSLPRIGPVMSQRIIQYRNENGQFTTVESLQKVKGIGKKTLAKLKPLIKID